MLDDYCPDAVAICVPVRNEAALLPALLDALARQQRVRPCAVTLCFIFDDCSDSSAAIVAGFAAISPYPVVTATLPASTPNAGRARRAAMALGCDAVAAARHGALLTTDADSTPASDWIATACRSLCDSDVVAGRIVRAGGERDAAQDRLDAYFDRLYALRRLYDPLPWEPIPAHHHVGGANLAFRASAYAALGGFSPVAAGEDGAIVDAAHRLGLRVRRDRAMVVHTSARHHGRAPGGLADHLRTLGDGATVTVAHPDDAVWQYRGHALARAAWPRIDVAEVRGRLAEELAVEPDHVDRVRALAVNAEAFATHVVPGGERLVPLAEAEAALERIEGARYGHAA